jgi:hypothetical protein
MKIITILFVAMVLTHCSKIELEKLIEEKNDYIKIQDKEIDTLKGQIDLKDLEIEMLKKK